MGPAYVAWRTGTIAVFCQLSRLKSGLKQWPLASLYPISQAKAMVIQRQRKMCYYFLLRLQ